MNFSETTSIYTASGNLLDPNQENRWLATACCGAYHKFNLSLNKFSKQANELDLVEVETVLSFLKFFGFVRRTYISTPLPCSRILQAFDRQYPHLSALPAELQSQGSALFNSYQRMRNIEEHPYEVAIAQIGDELSPSSLIRLVLPRRYFRKVKGPIQSRLSEYYELSIHKIEIVSPAEAARAEIVADVQIVLGNPDYLETPPFSSYRSFSCARASKIYSLCLAPHARKYCFDKLLRMFTGNGETDFPEFQSWDFEINEILGAQDERNDTEDLVFPFLSSAEGHESIGNTGDYEAITTLLQGSSETVTLNSRNILIASVATTLETVRIISVNSTDIDEIEIGDVVVIQKSGLRDAELAELGKLDPEYQKNRKLVFGWKERLRRADQLMEPWTLPRLLIRGGNMMKGVNQGQLDRWKSADHGCPGSDDTFRCLLALLEYTSNQITEIIAAKNRLHNHHRQAGKSLSNLAPAFLKDKTIRGNIEQSDLEFEVLTPPGPVKFVMLKISDITFDYNQ